jgi:hypothetical protein
VADCWGGVRSQAGVLAYTTWGSGSGDSGEAPAAAANSTGGLGVTGTAFTTLLASVSSGYKHRIDLFSVQSEPPPPGDVVQVPSSIRPNRPAVPAAAEVPKPLDLNSNPLLTLPTANPKSRSQLPQGTPQLLFGPGSMSAQVDTMQHSLSSLPRSGSRPSEITVAGALDRDLGSSNPFLDLHKAAVHPTGPQLPQAEPSLASNPSGPMNLMDA